MGAMKRVVIVIQGHLSTCPRMIKVADSLDEAGYAVRVVSGSFLPWAAGLDRRLHARRRWRWQPVRLARGSSGWLRSGLAHRTSRAIVDGAGAAHTPTALLQRACSRYFDPLLDATCAEPTDLVLGGTAGGLPVAAAAARRLGVPFALDLEDFHPGEADESAAGRAHRRRVEALEARLLPQAAFLTAGSQAIAEAYARRYRVGVVPVPNVFPRRLQPPAPGGWQGPLRLYWFGHTLSAGRGLEDVTGAAATIEAPLALCLRAAVVDEAFVLWLRHRAAAQAPRLTIELLPPSDPDHLVAESACFAVGLALEPGLPVNNALALSNKACTYALAGLALAVTDTIGQRDFARDLGEGAVLFTPGDVAALGAGLARWAREPAALARARTAAWSAAQRYWHWEHAAHRGRLMREIGSVLG
jgi:hypothetical protein